MSCNLTQYSLGARCAPRNRPAAVVQKGDGCRWVFIGTRLSHQTFSLTSLSHKSFSSAKSFSVCGGVLGSLHSGKHSKQVAALQPHASNEASATSFSLVLRARLSHEFFSLVFRYRYLHMSRHQLLHVTEISIDATFQEHVTAKPEMIGPSFAAYLHELIAIASFCPDPVYPLCIGYELCLSQDFCLSHQSFSPGFLTRLSHNIK